MASTPRYQIIEGMRMPLGFPAEGLVSGRLYEPDSDDIFVASYPKCGTTWVQHIVYLLLNRGEPLPRDKSLTEVFPHLEEVGREFVAGMARPRLIKTHLPLAMTPFSKHARSLKNSTAIAMVTNIWGSYSSLSADPTRFRV